MLRQKLGVFGLLTVLTTVALAYPGGGGGRPGRGPGRPDGRHPRHQNIDLYSPTEWGRPFMAETAPDNAILSGRFPGDVQASANAVTIRAQQICHYYGYGPMVTFRLENVRPGPMVMVGYGFRIENVSREWITPFRNERGQIVGYASTYSLITCARQ